MHCVWKSPAKWLQKIDDCHEKLYFLFAAVTEHELKVILKHALHTFVAYVSGF